MDPHDPAFIEFLHGWSEFFLLAGTAAVTLVGLLFVSLSLHLDALIVPSREPLLRLARITLLTFVMILALSLMMLAPGISRHITSVQLWVIALVFSVITVKLGSSKNHADHPVFPVAVLRQRVRMAVVGYGLIGLVGFGLWFGIDQTMYWLLGALCLLIGNAVGTSWDLLVRVGKLKHEDEPKK